MTKQKVQRYSEANKFCTDVGKGLAIWEDTDIYKDMISITSSDVFDAPIWTALCNLDRENCGDDPSDCDGKLVRGDLHSKCLKQLS